MSNASDEEARQAQLKLLEAVRKAHQEAIDRPYGRLLDVRWVPSQNNCSKCGTELIDWEKLEQISCSLEEKDHACLELRSDHFFDLRHHKSIELPNWVTEQTDLWSHDSEGDPWQIRAMGTATDLTGERFDVCYRICDSTSYIFIRDCRACHASDPLGVAAHLSEDGALRCEGPHSFVNSVRLAQQAEKDRLERMKNERLDLLQTQGGSEPTLDFTSIRAAEERLEAYLSHDFRRDGSRGPLDPRCETCGAVGVDVKDPCRFSFTAKDAGSPAYLAPYLWSSHCFVLGLDKASFPAWITPETPFFQSVETQDDRSQSERPRFSIFRLVRNGFIRPCSLCAAPDPFRYIERFLARSFSQADAPHDLIALAKEHEAYLEIIPQAARSVEAFLESQRGSAGQSADTSGPTRACPKCDRTQPESHQFCVQCGHKFS